MRMPGRRGLARVAVVVASLALGAALLVWLGDGGDDPASVATERVVRGTFRREVSALGSFQAASATPISCPPEVGRPQKIAFLAEDGAHVRSGEVVVAFDTSEAQVELADGGTDQAIADNNIARGEAKRDGTERKLSMQLDLTKAKLDRAEDVSPADEGVFSRHDLIEAEVDRDLLERQREIARENLDASRRLDDAQIALSRIERSKADIRIRQARMSLGSLEVLAPHDGIFMLKRRGPSNVLTVGQQIWPGQEIAEIPDLSVLEAHVQVLEADAAGLAVGCRGRVTIEGKPGRSYSGEVRHVDSVGTTRQDSPVKYYKAILALESTDAKTMRPGQRVRVRLVLEEQEDVLSIPRGALFERDGERVVYRLEGGAFRAVPVSIGRASVSRVVVTEGLREDDRVALRDPTRALRDILEERGVGGGTDGGNVP